MASTRPLSVMIVEDNPDAAETLAVLLGLYGHETRVSRTGEEAERMAAMSTPDVVILDIGLPGADGYAVAERLRAAPWQRRPLLIAVTGHHHAGERFRQAGFDHHFLKPVEPEVLQRLLDNHAARLAEGD
jgi:CheY-like chemotaxis protein